MDDRPSAVHRGQAHDRASAGAAAGGEVEDRHGAHSAEQTPVGGLAADLAGQIGGEGLGDGHQSVLPHDHLGGAHLLDRAKREHRIVGDPLVQFRGPHGQAAHHLAPPHRLRATRHHTGVDEVDDSVRDHLAMHAEVASSAQELQHLRRDGAQPDVQRRSVIDQACHVARDLLRVRARCRRSVLGQLPLDADHGIEGGDRDLRVSLHTRHRFIDLCDDQPRPLDRGRCGRDGYPEAAHPQGIGWGHLHDGDVDIHPTGEHAVRDFADQDGHVLRAAGGRQVRVTGTDHRGAMPQGRAERVAIVKDRDAVQQADAGLLDCHPLQRSDDAHRHCAPSADEHARPGGDHGRGLLGRHCGLLPVQGSQSVLDGHSRVPFQRSSTAAFDSNLALRHRRISAQQDPVKVHDCPR